MDIAYKEFTKLDIRGVESQGMLLAADDGKPVLLKPDKSVAPGSGIH